METLTAPEELHQRLEQGEAITVVDVRSEDRYRLGHVRGALHIPLEELESRMGEIPRGRPVVTY